MSEILRVARKEFRSFFATPAAYLFIGAFLAVTLFVFFWVETFFARNIADVRPLFQWFPLLLIFLVAALTMRAWSEERRAGTLESLLTAPVRPRDLVFGKFLAVMGLVALALLLTLPLAITVSILGPLDWGPVVGGYVATLFLAAAYVAIGLYMSGRTDNAIVALILTAVVCGLFYVIGTPTLTNLFGQRAGGILALLGSGTRFESITRGVLDLRDLYYYVSIVGVFLTLNLFSLERLRWAGNPGSPRHWVWGWVTGLAVLNFVAANVWLAPIAKARVDITAGHQYSLSDATKDQLAQLREPLLIRGYFSAKTHPLLAPLVPEIKDLLEEYAVAAGGHARVEFVDPTQDHAVEEEATAKYGIRPVPFQTASRYQTSVVSSYFDLVVAYGDQYEKLGYRDLIEVKDQNDGPPEIALKNPEYEITRAIRKAVNAYQAGGSPFETLTRPVVFHGYMSSDDHLPKQLRTLRADLKTVLDSMARKAGGKLQVSFEDPDANGGQLGRQLQERYGFSPQVASLFDTQPFWFYMVLAGANDTVQVPLPDAPDQDALKRSLDAAFKRLAPGFLKTVAVVKSPAAGQGMGYDHLSSALSENVRIKETDLKNGRVPEEADLLLVLAPHDLDDKQRFAVDQFLMRGGSVILSTSPFDVKFDQGLNAVKASSGLEEWLASYGITVDQSMVLDPKNAALPVPVIRYIGGFPVRDIQMLPYPHFPDLRGDELNPHNPITAELGQLTLNWASPIEVDAAKNKGRQLTTLLQSSPQSWASSDLDIVPQYSVYPKVGFAVSGERKARPLAVAAEGRFDSFYRDKPSPLAAAKPADTAAHGAAHDTTADTTVVTGVIQRSPESARLLVIGSNTFGSDMALELASEGLGTFYDKPVAFYENAIDWALEDRSLLALRGRTQFARTLEPRSESEERLWEYGNYAAALVGLLAVWGWRRWARARDRRRYQRILSEV